MVKRFTVNEPLLNVGCTLGEGCVWDTRKQRLYFVDIDQNKIYTYEPSSGIHGYQTFSNKIGSISTVEDGTGLIVDIDTGFAFVPFETSLPFPPDNSQKELQHVPIDIALNKEEKRFNEGTTDPAGRFLSGTMGMDIGTFDGRMFALQPRKDGTGLEAPLILDGITCTNGMGWSQDGKTMYFSDSWLREIAVFDYDLENGKMSNRRLFSKLDESYGWPDGMCTDAEGGIWSARWQNGTVIRLTPEGEIDVVIEFPKAWHMTCCIFGGPNLDELYVTTASSDYIGEDLPERSDGGHLFVVKGLGYKGVERNRFRGSVAQ
ncbi:regucalcin [Kwoniella heveanensis BCC8398]|uniref:Regucalcin n=1 Tax=Kwoniella heveanensis BCC8398 TaxID=1296120 RepID=A0A1B9GIP0_9TREE|nr:regucalcin [Kwoniella heveanensis BCC8398]